jgi:ATP-binding cassette subfamily B protein RaxB
VANFHGHRLDMNTLRQKFSVSIKGTNLKQVIDVANKLDLNARALKLPLEQLDQLETPAILRWDLNHFVVLKQAGQSGVDIHDPAAGTKRLSWEQASKSFTGVAVELKPRQDFQPVESRRRVSILGLCRRVTGLRRSLVQMLALTFGLQVFALASPYYMQLVIDNVVANNNKDLLILLGLGFLAIKVFEFLVTAFRSWIVLYFHSVFGIQIASGLFAHMLRLPQSWYDKRHVGDILSRFQSLNQITRAISTDFIESVMDGLMVVLTLVMMYIYSPMLATIALAALVLYALYRTAFYRTLRNATEEEIALQAKSESIFLESVRASLPIRLFNCQSPRLSKWQNSRVEALNADIRAGKLNIFYTAFHGLSTGLEYTLLIWLGALMILDNVFSVGMLYAFMAWRNQFAGKGQNLINKVFEYRMLSVHLERIADIATAEEEPHLDGPAEHADIARGGLVLENVAFRYDRNEPWLFHGLNLTVHPGESVALAAPSGYGKTTLLKIMAGVLQPEQGRVLVDGVDIRHRGLRNYRARIAAVMQDDQLLAGTIADNIAVADMEIDMHKVTECARRAAILEDILRMPMGFQTLVGDMGSSLSGDQKQRILLARALYVEPKILFLDEASSHLDRKTEQQINQALQDMSITRIIAAHRAETLETAGRVINLDREFVEAPYIRRADKNPIQTATT